MRDCFECSLPACVGGTVCVCVSVCVCGCTRVCVCGPVSVWACALCACTWRLLMGIWLKHCSPYFFFLFMYPPPAPESNHLLVRLSVRFFLGSEAPRPLLFSVVPESGVNCGTG